MKTLVKVLNVIFLMTALFIGLNPLWAQEDEEQTQKSEAVEDSGAVEEEPAEEEIKIPPRGQMGFVEIITTPEKATVYLDAEELGLSPIEKRPFRTGRFDLTIMLGGEELINERVNVWPDQTLTIEKKLVMPYGAILLTTKPGYTRVFIDGEEIGRTAGGPLTINNVTAGTHLIKVSAKGRRSREVEVTVNGEDTTKIDIKLGR